MIDGILILFILAYFAKRPHLLSPDYIDNYILQKEEKSKVNWLLFISFGLMICAALYCMPALKCVHQGCYYGSLASNPFMFNSENPVAFRLLTPMISYFIGLKGQGILITNVLISIVMIGTVYRYFRSVTKFPSDALFAAVSITFSMVILSTLHNAGYCDILTYLIIFLMYRFQKQRVVFFLLFFLGLTNRESIAFLIPWFAFISWESSDNKKIVILDLILGFSISLILYHFYREWILSGNDVLYSTSYYLEPMLKNPFALVKPTMINYGVGLFSIFKLMWIVPLFYMFVQIKSKKYKPLFEIFLIIFCCYLQLFIAGDTTRMLTQAFMVFIISLKALYQSEYAYLRKYQFWLIGINLLIPQINTAFGIVEIWNSTFLYILKLAMEFITSILA